MPALSLVCANSADAKASVNKQKMWLKSVRFIGSPPNPPTTVSGRYCRRISRIANAIVHLAQRSGICEIAVGRLTAIRRNRFLI